MLIFQVLVDHFFCSLVHHFLHSFHKHFHINVTILLTSWELAFISCLCLLFSSFLPVLSVLLHLKPIFGKGRWKHPPLMILLDIFFSVIGHRAGFSWLLMFFYQKVFLKVLFGIYKPIARYRLLFKATNAKFSCLK